MRFSERKKFKAQEDKIRQVFDNLIQLEHPNIVKFHKYWIDSRDDKPRVLGTFSFDRSMTVSRLEPIIWLGSFFAGDLYHRVHVVGLAEAVPQTHQAQRQEAAAAGLETLVHPDPLGPQVIVERVPSFSFRSVDVVLRFRF